VSYPKGDFAYTLVRQYLFDESERVRLGAFAASSEEVLRQASGKILPEEGYHLLHTSGLVERLGDATEESHARMQSAVDEAFPQALGIFEPLEHESELVSEKVYPGVHVLREEWLERVKTHLRKSSLTVPAAVKGAPDFGGRMGDHAPHLEQLVKDLQSVYGSESGASW
jgi:ring-1,2-phenylacetyl-CoA epoxidase subunit PaaC